MASKTFTRVLVYQRPAIECESLRETVSGANISGALLEECKKSTDAAVAGCEVLCREVLERDPIPNSYVYGKTNVCVARFMTDADVDVDLGAGFERHTLSIGGTDATSLRVSSSGYAQQLHPGAQPVFNDPTNNRCVANGSMIFPLPPSVSTVPPTAHLCHLFRKNIHFTTRGMGYCPNCERYMPVYEKYDVKNKRHVKCLQCRARFCSSSGATYSRDYLLAHLETVYFDAEYVREVLGASFTVGCVVSARHVIDAFISKHANGAIKLTTDPNTYVRMVLNLHAGWISPENRPPPVTILSLHQPISDRGTTLTQLLYARMLSVALPLPGVNAVLVCGQYVVVSLEVPDESLVHHILEQLSHEYIRFIHLPLVDLRELSLLRYNGDCLSSCFAVTHGGTIVTAAHGRCKEGDVIQELNPHNFKMERIATVSDSTYTYLVEPPSLVNGTLNQQHVDIMTATIPGEANVSAFCRLPSTLSWVSSRLACIRSYEQFWSDPSTAHLYSRSRDKVYDFDFTAGFTFMERQNMNTPFTLDELVSYCRDDSKGVAFLGCLKVEGKDHCNIQHSVGEKCFCARYWNEVFVVVNGSYPYDERAGDSGSPLFTRQRDGTLLIVGMLIAGSPKCCVFTPSPIVQEYIRTKCLEDDCDEMQILLPTSFQQ